jgi:NTE family protein
VCGGGGDVGVAYMAGCMAAIYEVTGWDMGSANYIVGTSAGAIVGAALRAGIPPADFHATMRGEPVAARSAQILTPEVLGHQNELPPLAQDALTNARLTGLSVITQIAKNPLSTHPIPLVAAALPEGRLNSDFVRNKIINLMGEEWPSEPLLVVATRMDNGHRVVLTNKSRVQTDLPTAVAASCAIPLVFKPVTIDDTKYVDGGLASSTNADILLRHELDAVIILAPLSTGSAVTPTLSGPMRQTSRSAVKREASKLRKEGASVLTFHPNMKSIHAMGLNLMDVSKRPKVSTYAHEAALELLERERSQMMVQILKLAAKT